MAESIVVICPTRQAAKLRQNGTTGNLRIRDLRTSCREGRAGPSDLLCRSSAARKMQAPPPSSTDERNGGHAALCPPYFISQPTPPPSAAAPVAGWRGRRRA